MAAPIRHPVRGTVAGALNLTCRVDEFNPFARTVLRQAVTDIERRLFEASSRHEQQLLAHYTARAKRVGRPLIAVSADMFICNPAASAALERDDRELLWHWAGSVLNSHATVSERLVLASGRTVLVHASRLSDGPRLVGALIEFDDVEPRSGLESVGGHPLTRVRSASTGAKQAIVGAPGDLATAEARADETLGVTGHSPAAAALRGAIARAIEMDRPVLVTGEPSSGRRRVARTLLARTATPQPAFVDGASADWLDQVAAAVDAGIPVLLRNLAAGDHAFKVTVERAERAGVPLIATTAEADPDLAGVFPLGIAVPPLRERRGDLRDLTVELIAKLSPGRSLGLHPRALLALEAHDWPGNVRELQYVLSLAIQSCTGDELLQRHLPGAIASRGEGLTPIEKAEREAILAALSASSGNKLAAASALGFARSTLYRKMRALKIDDRAPF